MQTKYVEQILNFVFNNGSVPEHFDDVDLNDKKLIFTILLRRMFVIQPNYLMGTEREANYFSMVNGFQNFLRDCPDKVFELSKLFIKLSESPWMYCVVKLIIQIENISLIYLCAIPPEDEPKDVNSLEGLYKYLSIMDGETTYSSIHLQVILETFLMENFVDEIMEVSLDAWEKWMKVFQKIMTDHWFYNDAYVSAINWEVLAQIIDNITPDEDEVITGCKETESWQQLIRHFVSRNNFILLANIYEDLTHQFVKKLFMNTFISALLEKDWYKECSETITFNGTILSVSVIEVNGFAYFLNTLENISDFSIMIDIMKKCVPNDKMLMVREYDRLKRNKKMDLGRLISMRIGENERKRLRSFDYNLMIFGINI